MNYNAENLSEIVQKQRNFFNSGETLSLDFRLNQLKKIKQLLINNEEKIKEALYLDLGRSPTEAYLLDIGPCIAEINETIKGLRKWARPEYHFSGLLCFPSIITKVYKMPYGVTLIISPFNFPFLLSFGVLLASIAAGNTAVLKLSSKSKHSSALIKELISTDFPAEYLVAIDGGHEVADLCLDQRFDKIFYTGSPKVGVHVMECAAKNLTPVALELGGENVWALSYNRIFVMMLFLLML